MSAGVDPANNRTMLAQIARMHTERFIPSPSLAKNAPLLLLWRQFHPDFPQQQASRFVRDGMNAPPRFLVHPDRALFRRDIILLRSRNLVSAGRHASRPSVHADLAHRYCDSRKAVCCARMP
jgi:hypothetical protein